MELYQVKYFLALCETLNFTRAANNCNVSQPSLTRAIQNLEGEFGGPLFHRERQRTHLTELGRLMQPYFEQVYAQAQAAKDAAKSFAKLDDISLKIGVMCTIGPSMLADFFGRFRDRYPGVEVQFLDAAGYRSARCCSTARSRWRSMAFRKGSRTGFTPCRCSRSGSSSLFQHASVCRDRVIRGPRSCMRSVTSIASTASFASTLVTCFMRWAFR